MAVRVRRDDDVDTPDRSHKPVPEWARSHKLYEALKSQQHTDPDSIFGARQTTCDLADMFAGRLHQLNLTCCKYLPYQGLLSVSVIQSEGIWALCKLTVCMSTC
eukprot:GHUV01050153.1.p1 GENE.GHUV01050153.1~~GHUV01050153.1.p1  ORF type:complete len:104 (+),score=9.50 GHUV01050153.1:163-474(+)